MITANYDPRAALEFFKHGGKVKKIAQGATIFRENKRRSRILLQRDWMYLLLQGEVGLLAGNQLIRIVKPGEIFGEMAAISAGPRSATAVAKSACRVIGLDDRTFRTALKKKPSFALMLISLMIRRLRETIARLKAADALTGAQALEESAVFNPRLLASMASGMSDDPPVSYLRHQTILQEGQMGTRAYAVLEGRVAVSIGGTVIDRIGPGGVLGELAVLDGSARLASAVAEDNCRLLPINRNAFVELVKLKPELGVSLLTALAGRLRFLTARLK
jgi:CRP/FNR family transcriptional regulator, cyclic AMP receptor protein